MNFSLFKNLDYYESLIMIAVSLLIILEYALQGSIELQSSGDWQLIIAMLPFVFCCFILLVFDNLNYNTKSMAFSSVMLSGLLIGFIHFSSLLSLILLFGLVGRIVKSPKSEYGVMLLIALSGMVTGFLTNSAFGFFKGQFFDFSIVNIFSAVTLMLLTLLILFFEYLSLFDNEHKVQLQVLERENRIKSLSMVNNSLSRFVPDQIWQPIIRDNMPANLFNKRAKLTIFFSDIVGFTQLSDNLSADLLTEILGDYMDRMTIIAKRHDVVLDKFIGDGMMCFFGAHGNKSVKDNALSCIEMAIDMRREMRDMRRQWKDKGYELYIRMGINTDFCHVGNFGTNLRMSYTAIGKAVNLASRLESVAKPDEIIISQSTYDYVMYDYNCEIVGDVHLKGFEDAVTCWRVQDPVTSELKATQWVDHDLPGFNLHLNFKDIKNYDYQAIRRHLSKAIERIDSAEIISELSVEKQKY